MMGENFGRYRSSGPYPFKIFLKLLIFIVASSRLMLKSTALKLTFYGHGIEGIGSQLAAPLALFQLVRLY